MAADMKKKREPNAHFNLFLLVVIFALFFVAIYFINYEKNTPTAKPIVLFPKSPEFKNTALIKALDSKYEGKFISYVDPEYGYKVKYPIGYEAFVNPTTDIHQRFFTAYPINQVELYDLRIFESSVINEALIKSNALEANATLETLKINGKTIFLSSLKMPSEFYDNESVYVRQAFYSCKDPKGKSYWLSFTAGITEGLVGDLEVAEYMIRTLEC